MNENMYKFGIVSEGDTESEYIYPNLWSLEELTDCRRISVAPKVNHVTVILDLLKEVKPPYWILYLLVVPRTDYEPGRYQCTKPLTYDEVSSLFTQFRDYLEQDGRHHIWVGSSVTDEMIVYDHHNVLYLYNIERQAREYLEKNRYKEGSIWFPVPHSHNFHPTYDKAEVELMTHYEWKRFPLQEQDYSF